jgi:hypothetical protein
MLTSPATMPFSTLGLLTAVEMGHLELVEFLLDVGADLPFPRTLQGRMKSRYACIDPRWVGILLLAFFLKEDQYEKQRFVSNC